MYVRRNEISFEKETKLYAYIVNQNGTNINASLNVFVGE